MRLFLAAVVMLELVAAGRASAQVPAATVDELGHALGPGDVITVVQTTGDSVRGRLLRIGNTDLTIHAETQRVAGRQRRLEITIPLSAIQSLERPRDPSRNGALIGAGIGAGVAGTMFLYAVAIDRNEIEEWAPIYLGFGAVSSGIGALVGWAIDSGHSKSHIRFDARSTGTPRVRVVPLRSREPGLAAAVSF